MSQNQKTGWTEADIDAWIKEERRDLRRAFWQSDKGVETGFMIFLAVLGVSWCLIAWAIS